MVRIQRDNIAVNAGDYHMMATRFKFHTDFQLCVGWKLRAAYLKNGAWIDFAVSLLRRYRKRKTFTCFASLKRFFQTGDKLAISVNLVQRSHLFR